MSITVIQPLIKIGTSKGVTLPARELKRLGIDVGDEVEIIARKKSKQVSDDKAIDIAENLLKKYSQDFNNLSKR